MKLLIAITGPKQSGKSTFSKILKEEINQPGTNTYLFSIADSLRYVLKFLFTDTTAIRGFHKDASEDEKNTPIKSLPITDEARIRFNLNPNLLFWTPRMLLQIVGTDCLRAIYSDIFVAKTISQIAETPHCVIAILDDMRFMSEYVGFQRYCDTNNIIFMPIRVLKTGMSDRSKDTHASEQEAHTIPVHTLIVEPSVTDLRKTTLELIKQIRKDIL